MKRAELQRSELIAIVGGLLMALGLFLTWYHLKNGNVSIANQTGPADLSGWTVHTIIRWLLLAAAAAPLILAWIILRGHALSWPRGEMTAVSSVAAVGLIGYSAFIDKPGDVASLISLRPGIFLALLGALAMLGGSALRASATERPRKPPGVI
jgi:hypothetical protein